MSSAKAPPDPMVGEYRCSIEMGRSSLVNLAARSMLQWRLMRAKVPDGTGLSINCRALWHICYRGTGEARSRSQLATVSGDPFNQVVTGGQ
jgi:hypothetical protein